jgi:cytochrome oxidase Cu insertion factor (SCO1/SenC/PrrC family)
MTRLFVLTVLSVVVLSLASCGGGGQQSGASPEGNGAETPGKAPEVANPSGEDAADVDTEQASSNTGGKDFSVTTVEGKEFDLSEKQGEVVALYFMAGW